MCWHNLECEELPHPTVRCFFRLWYPMARRMLLLAATASAFSMRPALPQSTRATASPLFPRVSRISVVMDEKEEPLAEQHLGRGQSEESHLGVVRKARLTKEQDLEPETPPPKAAW